MTNQPRYILAPFLPSPPDVVDRMLTLAEVSGSDRVFDLGCGDGRVVIAAARRHGARGVGVDIEPYRVEESRQNALLAGVSDRVRFEHGDALTIDLSQATVIFLYLVHWSMQMLAPVIARQVVPGTRIVSHSFPITSWTPTRTDTFFDSTGLERTLYLWVCAGDRGSPP